MASAKAYCAAVVIMCAANIRRKSEKRPSRAATHPGLGSARPFRCKYRIPATSNPSEREVFEKPGLREIGTSRTSISSVMPLSWRLANRSEGLLPSYPTVKSVAMCVRSCSASTMFAKG
jgi:hypothetical protein